MLPMQPLPKIDSKYSLRSEKSATSSKHLTGKRATFKTKALIKKRNDLTVYFNDEMVTPKLLNVLEAGQKNDTLSLSQLEVRSQYELSVFGNVSTSVLHTHMHTQSIAAVSQSYVSLLNKDSFLDSVSIQSYTSTTSVATKDIPVYVPPRIMPTTLNITLTETPVMYLLELASTTELKGTEQGDLVEKDNELYDYLTVGKGRNRKTTNAEIQTSMYMLKTRSTNAQQPGTHKVYTFASDWDMHDTYEKLKDTDQKIITDTVTANKKTGVKEEHDEHKDAKSVEQQMESLLENPKFQESVLIMERVLANNTFNQQQKRFRGLIEQDPFRPDIEFKYNLELLWTFKIPQTENYPVTAMQWHPINHDILGVGYGKFYYSDNKKGYLACWNVKNPKQPEREIWFDEPVTALSFNEFEPNLLGVGLYNGSVLVLDISNKKVDIVVKSKTHLTTSYEPIWQMSWFPPDGYNIYENHVMTACQDGRICSFVVTKTNDLNEILMMRVFRAETKIKGVYVPKPCSSNEIPIDKSTAALTITKHPNEDVIYYIGTCEGAVHKCSKNYHHQHIDITMCHNGPVYNLQFSHFLSRIFLTCGADSCIHIWSEDIKEPLITMTNTMWPVEGAEWCPTNSTIIANISGSSIYLWDVQRKTYLPASEHPNPNNCRYTIIKFSPCGKNLVVGDIEGNIHVYALADMPFPPFYQASMLEKVICKNLITRSDLVSILKKSNFKWQEGGDRTF